MVMFLSQQSGLHPLRQVTRAIAEGDTIGREVEDNAKARTVFGLGGGWGTSLEISDGIHVCVCAYVCLLFFLGGRGESHAPSLDHQPWFQ